MQYYDVVHLFKTSEIRTDLGVLNAVIVYQGRKMHILFEKNRIDIPAIDGLIQRFNLIVYIVRGCTCLQIFKIFVHSKAV